MQFSALSCFFWNISLDVHIPGLLVCKSLQSHWTTGYAATPPSKKSLQNTTDRKLQSHCCCSLPLQSASVSLSRMTRWSVYGSSDILACLRVTCFSRLLSTAKCACASMLYLERPPATAEWTAERTEGGREREWRLCPFHLQWPEGEKERERESKREREREEGFPDWPQS